MAKKSKSLKKGKKKLAGARALGKQKTLRSAAE